MGFTKLTITLWLANPRCLATFDEAESIADDDFWELGSDESESNGTGRKSHNEG